MSKQCTDAALYESLNFCQGKAILPGIRQKVYAQRKRNIVGWPTLPAAAEAAMKELAIYQGNFTLAADQKWLCVDLTLNKGVVEWETQGEVPSRTFLNKATLNHPEIDEDAAAFSRQAIMDDFVYIVQQRDGKWRVLGNEAFQTDTKPKGSTGEGTTGEGGTTLEIEVTDVCPAPFYTGTLETDEGTFDCSTNQLRTGA